MIKCVFQIVSEYCIDLDSIHQTGRSNGGMFSYHIAAHMERFDQINTAHIFSDGHDIRATP